MNTFLAAFASLFIFNCSLTQAVDFRLVDWGASRAQVEKSEKEKPASIGASDIGGSWIGYVRSMGGLDCYILYYFNDSGQLYEGHIVFAEEHLGNDSPYLGEYRAINNILVKKYGEFIGDDEVWLDEHSQEYFASKPWDAIAIGDLMYWAEWKTDRTSIIHKLIGADYEIKHVVSYQSLIYTQEVKTDGF